MNHTQENDDPSELGQILWRVTFDEDINISTVEALIDAGADVNFQPNGGWTPLHNAIENYQVDLVVCLLSNGAGVNISDSYGTTPLHLSIDVECQAVATEYDMNRRIVPVEVILTKLLIDHGANIHTRDYLGKTPLDWAIAHGHEPAQKLLREREALESKMSD